MQVNRLGQVKAGEAIDTISLIPTSNLRLEEHWTWAGGTLVAIDKFSDGRPSPAVLAAIGQMRATVNMMNEFNSANNFSYCMSSSGNQRYDVETRKQYRFQ